jgi:hypothetical protein
MFFHYGMLYLSVLPEGALPLAEKVQWIQGILLAALLSDKIYHFGELLLSAHLSILLETPSAWLAQLVIAMNVSEDDPGLPAHTASFEFLMAQHASDVFLISFLFF